MRREGQVSAIAQERGGQARTGHDKGRARNRGIPPERNLLVHRHLLVVHVVNRHALEAARSPPGQPTSHGGKRERTAQVGDERVVELTPVPERDVHDRRADRQVDAQVVDLGRSDSGSVVRVGDEWTMSQAGMQAVELWAHGGEYVVWGSGCR